ncbi:phosphonate ABC transporter ATP-binding protein [Limnohabitans sp. 63ED37-2]|uniref:phosphonate ABC transporter ATP-binding protein n=1 Tax=Limnohabitans sp. 63ED37-2 TaxID=1678128 RepID=UPI000705D78E|nr:ATP-binding cassette domain-containing protein [Limnohabitans sp. 63ED37-2]ALK90084.1 Phosphate-import ATP-binding protein PhnC [Limnohabitans sp. 63ED37-2]
MNIELLGLEARHPAALPGAPAALRALNLRLAAGEQVAIIGPSGAGKTTLLQVLACAQPPTQGSLQLAGVNPWTLSARALRSTRGQLFLAPQVPPLPPRQRVVTSVLAGRLPSMGLWASLRSLFYPADIPAAYEALVHFDLGDKLFDRVDRLSGGERQRVGLARALLAPASLWLIDEPLSALDPMRARMAMSALVNLAAERQVTLVATLHQVDMALAHFPRVIGLRDGQLVFDLPSAQVSPERLAHLYDQYEHELRGEVLSVALPDDAPARPAPVVMHCR